MIYQTEETREKIIRVSEALFVANGFAETQMKDIAAATEVSRNTLYRYYQDKYDLGFAILVMVLKRKVTLASAIMDEIEARKFPTILDGVEALMKSYADTRFRDDDRFIAEFDGYYAGSRIPAEFRAKLTDFLSDELGQRMECIYQLGQDEGSIRRDLSAAYLGVTIFNAVPTFFRRMLLRREALVEMDAESIPRLTPVLIQLLVDGLKPQNN